MPAAQLWDNPHGDSPVPATYRRSFGWALVFAGLAVVGYPLVAALAARVTGTLNDRLFVAIAIIGLG